MTKASASLGYLTFTLHSHLPYVVNHGTWPHGLDWLHEATAETYLPLLEAFEELEREGLALKANVNLSPVLLEQLDHPVFKEEFPQYVQQKIDAATEDERWFRSHGEDHFVGVAQFWRGFYENTLRRFEHFGRDVVGAFRRFYESGAIEIITCGATHGYFALLGTDASIRAQVRMGLETHQRFFRRKPRGIWLPECSYRPAGEWRFPVPAEGFRGSFPRAGVEQILSEYGIEFFFVDSHLVEKNPRFTPYELLAGNVPVATEAEPGEECASLYRPYYAGSSKSAFFARDPRTGIQVWSGEHGYPGDPVYLDFHKKRWPGGHRYWQVTHPKIDLGAKTAYFPDLARSRTRAHAMHFSDVVNGVLRYHAPQNNGRPILTAPFDAELFGHWWFEGPEWLKNVAREIAHPDNPVKLITCAEYLDDHKPGGYLQLPEGSWGRNGTHEVWLNPLTEWTWSHIYPAELAMEQVARSGRWRGNETATRLAKQLARELLLLESSDWQFLITTEHARDYAEKRFHTHLDQFRKLLDAWRKFEVTGEIADHALTDLQQIEERDSIFPGITPDIYAEEPVTV